MKNLVKLAAMTAFVFQAGAMNIHIEGRPDAATKENFIDWRDIAQYDNAGQYLETLGELWNIEYYNGNPHGLFSVIQQDLSQLNDAILEEDGVNTELNK